MNILNRKTLIPSLMAATALLSNPAHAASLTWNDGGTGAWDNSGALNWSTGGSSVAWTSGDDAVFGVGTSGTFAVSFGSSTGANSLTFKSSTYNLTYGSARTLTLSSTSSTLVVNTGATANIGGSVTVRTPTVGEIAEISGGGTLNLNSGGKFLFFGNNSSRALWINETTVNVGAGAELSTNQTAATPLFVNGNLNVNGGIANSWGLLGIGQTGTAGTVTINSGTVNADGNGGIRFGASSGSSQGGTVNLDGGVLRVGKFEKNAAATVANSTLNLNGGTLVAKVATTGFTSGLSRINVRDGGAKIDTAGFNITISQALSHSNINGDAAMDGGLTKSGSGTLTLSGTSTYTGPTVVNGGKLVGVSGSTSSLSVSAGAELRVPIAAGHMDAVPVSIAGTFGVEGYRFGAVTMASTGRLEAGSGAALVAPSFASFSGTTGATLSIQLGKTTAGTAPAVNTDYERINVRNGGSVLLNNMTLDLQTTANTGNIEEGDLFFIVYNLGTNAVQGIFAGLAQGSIFEWQNKFFQISYTAHWSGNYSTSKMTDGNDVALLAVIPEPNTWAFLLGGFGMLLQFQRARKRVGTR